MANTESEMYLLYYTHGPRGQERIWYVSERPGDGGKDWGYTLDRSKAVALPFFYLRRWVALRRQRAGWYRVA